MRGVEKAVELISSHIPESQIAAPATLPTRGLRARPLGLTVVPLRQRRGTPVLPGNSLRQLHVLLVL